jgi:crossover junction endodeoxyribonuclease RuvC
VRVLGIDPGSRLTGWGVVEEGPVEPRHVASGTLALGTVDTLGARLARLHAACLALVAEWRPAVVVLERAFVARNVHSALRLGEARGAVLAAVGTAGAPLREYAPAEVKLATAGHGGAGKDAIGRGVVALLRLGRPLQPDAADALALALCHLQRMPLERALAAVAPGPPVAGRRRGARTVGRGA